MRGLPAEHFRAVLAVLAHAAELTGGPVRLELGAFTGALVPGDRGERVRRLQRELMRAGQALPRHGADGHFGPETLGALRRHAREKGSGTPERVTPELWAVLFGRPEAIVVEPDPRGARLTAYIHRGGHWQVQATDRLERSVPAELTEAAAALLRSGSGE